MQVKYHLCLLWDIHYQTKETTSKGIFHASSGRAFRVVYKLELGGSDGRETADDVRSMMADGRYLGAEQDPCPIQEPDFQVAAMLILAYLVVLVVPTYR